MKTFLTTCAIAALALLGATPQAEARSHRSTKVYISGYTQYGDPIYVERYLIGYDRRGEPVWGKRVIRPAYRTVERRRHVAPCPPPVRYYPERDYRGSRVVIQGSFRL